MCIRSFQCCRCSQEWWGPLLAWQRQTLLRRKTLRLHTGGLLESRGRISPRSLACSRWNRGRSPGRAVGVRTLATASTPWSPPVSCSILATVSGMAPPFASSWAATVLRMFFVCGRGCCRRGPSPDSRTRRWLSGRQCSLPPHPPRLFRRGAQHGPQSLHVKGRRIRTRRRRTSEAPVGGAGACGVGGRSNSRPGRFPVEGCSRTPFREECGPPRPSRFPNPRARACPASHGGCKWVRLPTWALEGPASHAGWQWVRLAASLSAWERVQRETKK